MISRVLHPLAMLIVTVLAVRYHEPLLASGVGAAALVASFVHARAHRSARGGLAAANLVTLARLLLVAVLPLLAREVPLVAIGAITLGLLALDGVDGRVARARGESSAFGAAFDMETDALTVLVLGLVLHARAGILAWVLIAGDWRYAFALAVAFVPAVGDCPPSPLYRRICGLLVVALALAFVPWPLVARASAAVGTLLVSWSFVHSIVRSRAFASARITGAVGPARTPASFDRR